MLFAIKRYLSSIKHIHTNTQNPAVYKWLLSGNLGHYSAGSIVCTFPHVHSSCKHNIPLLTRGASVGLLLLQPHQTVLILLTNDSKLHHQAFWENQYVEKSLIWHHCSFMECCCHKTTCRRPGSGLVYFRPSPCKKVSTATGRRAGVRTPCKHETPQRMMSLCFTILWQPIR